MRRLLAIALLAGCAHYSQEDGEKLANEVYALQTQLQAMQKSLREQQQLGERHAERLEAIGIEVDTLSRAARRNDADLGVQVDNVLQQMAEFRGLVESTRDRTDLLEQELNRIKEEAKVSGAASEEDKQKAIEAAKARERILANPDTLVSEALALVNQQKLEEARSLIREFQLRAKDNAALERWRGEAQYLLAETFFVEKDYKRAATEYNAVRKNFPKSDKVPDALYKMGLCFEKLDLPADDAKLFYQTVLSKYPKSNAAKAARERLTALEKKK